MRSHMNTAMHYCRFWYSYLNICCYTCLSNYTKSMIPLRTVLVVYLSVPFLMKSSYKLYPLMLETVCRPLTSLIYEIKTLLNLWKYQIILVIKVSGATAR